MSRAWQETAPEERLGEARPGALLTAAGAVPLAIAVLLAAGLLPWGARLALGVAVAVLGVRIRALDGTPIGARIRPEIARALGAGVLVAGIVLIVGAVGVALDGGRLDRLADFDPEDPPVGLAAAGGGFYGVFAVLGPSLDGWAGVVTGVLLGAAGLAVARVLRPAGPLAGGTGAAVGSSPAVDRPDEPGAAGRTTGVGTALAGLGVALAFVALTGGGMLGLGPDARAIVLVLLAGVAAGVVATRPGDPMARAVGVAGGVVLALLVGEATALVQLTLAGNVGPPVVSPPREGVIALVLVAAHGVAATLVVVAARRADAVLGVLPVGVLLLTHPTDGGVLQVAVLLVPVLLVVLAGTALLGVGPALRVVPRPAAPAALGVAVLVLLVGLVAAFSPTGFSVVSAVGERSEVDGGRLVLAVVVTAGLVSIAAAAVRASAVTGVVLASTAIVGLHVLHPLALFRAAAQDSFLGDTAFAVILPAVELAAGLALARRHPAPVVLAAAGLLVASSLQAVAFGIALADDDLSGELVAVLTLGPATLTIAGAALYALVGPARRVLRAQALAVGAAVGALQFGSFATAAVAFAGAADGARLEGGQAVLAVALVAIAALGVAFLAASTARRVSGTIGVATLGVTVLLAMVVASVASAVGGGPLDDITSVGAPLAQVAVGFEASGSLLQRAGAGWPVLLGLLGAVLLATGAWLESRRPAPPDAPVG